MAAQESAYARDLDKNPANYAPLTPLSFLERTASVYPDLPSVIHGRQRYTWRETYARCRRLASALGGRGIGVGDTVAVMLPNIPAMYEAHFGVPMAGAVLNTLNTRLDAEAMRRPRGFQATAYTSYGWPRRTVRSCHLAVSQTRRVLSAPAEARRRPSGL